MSAASLAATYDGGGKTDWFLPSRDELNELCKYARTQTTGNLLVECNSEGILRNNSFAAGGYWSSSEDDASNAWFQYFSIYSNQPRITSKDRGGSVRPVRAF